MGPSARALALLALACSKASAPQSGSILLAVVRDAEQQRLPVRRLEVHLFVPDGIAHGDEVTLGKTGIFGAPTRAIADVKDVDGDGKLEVTVEFESDPFAGREVDMHLSGTVRGRPIRIHARTLDFEAALTAEGDATKDTEGHDILLAPGRERIVEVLLRCVKPGGCSTDGGVADAGDDSDASEAGDQ